MLVSGYKFKQKLVVKLGDCWMSHFYTRVTGVLALSKVPLELHVHNDTYIAPINVNGCFQIASFDEVNSSDYPSPA